MNVVDVMIGGWEEPVSWEQAQAYIKANTVELLARMNRNESGRTQYRRAMAELKTQYVSTQDYLYERLFGAQTRLNSEGKKEALKPPAFTDSAAPATIVLRGNDFPYNFQEGISHYILWSSRPLDAQEIDKQIRAVFPSLPTLYWVNPPELQSVLEIWHAHVLVLKAMGSS